jgi:AcrR family transcriptional regulator
MAETAESTGPSGPRARQPLSRERILLAAIELADAGGIEALSMRRLALELGVEAMSLYNHVDNKGAILDEMVDRVVDEITLPARGEPWEEALRACAISEHDLLLRHPWVCPLLMAPPSSGIVAPNGRMRYLESILACLRTSGFPPALAYHAYHAFDSFVVGFTMWQIGYEHTSQVDDEAVERVLGSLPASEFPHLIEHARQHVTGEDRDDVDEFTFGLENLLESLRRRLAASS